MKRTGTRSVKNHQNLLNQLKRKFEKGGTTAAAAAPAAAVVPIIVKEFISLSMKDSMKLFSSTDIVLGPHGAGLSNILFMKPGRGVIEFMVAGKDVNACYMYLTIKLGLRYHTWSDPKSTQNGAMTVDINEIISITNQIKNDLIEESIFE